LKSIVGKGEGSAGKSPSYHRVNSLIENLDFLSLIVNCGGIVLMDKKSETVEAEKGNQLYGDKAGPWA